MIAPGASQVITLKGMGKITGTNQTQQNMNFKSNIILGIYCILILQVFTSLSGKISYCKNSSQSHKTGCKYEGIALKFDSCFHSTAAEMPVKL